MSEIKSLQDRLDAVYHERNQLAIALARLVLIHDDLKFSDLAGYGFDPATGRAVVYVTLPSGAQVSWHMSDRITRDWQVNGCTSLPTFSGKWDGTFVGREENWPVNHIRAKPRPNPLYAIKVGIDIMGKACASGIGAAIAANAAANTTKSRSVDCDPLGATHYRACTGGNRRFYRKVDGTWLYFHKHDESWHPTDLSAAYLEDHIQEIKTPHVVLGASTTVNATGVSETNLGQALNDTILGVSWLVDISGRNTNYFVGGNQEVFWHNGDCWEPAAASAGWVGKSGKIIGLGSIAVRK